MEKKYLSDCIRYTTDIAPYPFIQIYSGVGSGKNTFVDALAKGYEESQPDGRMETLEPKRVLCITSRRAKVDELKNAEDVAYGTQVLEYESLDYVEDLDSYFASKRELSCNGIWGTIPHLPAKHRLHERSHRAIFGKALQSRQSGRLSLEPV